MAEERVAERVLLSLDGGGVRGYSSLLIIEKIMENIRDLVEPGGDVPLPCKWFDMIGGTSTGGLIAIMLGRLRMPVEKAIIAYRDLAKEAFVPIWHRTRISTAGMYSATKLKAKIVEIIEQQPAHTVESLFRDVTACKTVVLATTKADTRATPALFQTYDTSSSFAEVKIWEVGRATSAALTFFKSMPCGRDKIEFLDSGFGTNNPCQVLIDEATEVFPNTRLSCVVSIGTGLQGTIAITGSFSVLKSLKEMATNSNDTHMRVQARFITDPAKPYVRLDVPQGIGDINLADWRETPNIASHSNNYLNDPATKATIRRCAQAIVAAHRRQPADPASCPSGPVLEPDAESERSQCPTSSTASGSSGEETAKVVEARILGDVPSLNTHFVPREEIYQWLDTQLAPSDQTSIKQVALVGMGGAGKTQLASQYVHTRRVVWSLWAKHVIWIGCRNPQSMKEQYRALAQDLNIHFWHSIDPNITSDEKSFKYWLERSTNWLLILDDVMNWEMVQKSLPTQGSGVILFTVRDKQVMGTHTEILLKEVTLLDEPQAILLFLKRLLSGSGLDINTVATALGSEVTHPGTDRDGVVKTLLQERHGIRTYGQLQKIAQFTGYLPLGLVHCAAYARKHVKVFDKYMETLTGSRSTVRTFFLQSVPGVPYNGQNLMETFNVSLELVTSTRPRAAKILQLLGFLDRGSTTVDFLKSALENARYWTTSLTFTLPKKTREFFRFLDLGQVTSQDIDEDLSELVALSLIDKIQDEKTIHIHSLVHDWIHSRVPQGEVVSWLNATISLLRHRLPPLLYSETDRHISSQSEQVLGHAHRVHELSQMYLEDLLADQELADQELAAFFVEIYLWDHNAAHLELANRLNAKFRNRHDAHVTELCAAATMLDTFETYQNNKETPFYRQKYADAVNRLEGSTQKGSALNNRRPLESTQLSGNNAFPDYHVRCSITLAEISCRMIVNSFDETSVVGSPEERVVGGLINLGNDRYFQWLKSRTESETKSIVEPGTVCQVISLVYVYACVRNSYQRSGAVDPNAGYEQLDRVRASLIQLSHLGIRELRQGLELFLDFASQKLVRLEGKFIEEFVGIYNELLRNNCDPAVLLKRTTLPALFRKYRQHACLGGNTGTVNSFAPIDLGNLTGCVYSTSNLLKGNNLSCFMYQIIAVAAPDMLTNGGIIGDVVTAAVKMTLAVNAVISGLGCPQLQSYDDRQLTKYPGYTKLRKNATYAWSYDT